MKKFISVSLAAAAVLMVCASPGHAWRGGGWGWGWGPVLGAEAVGLGLWAATAPYYAYPYAVPPVQGTDIYVQPAMPQQPAETNFWYYCQNPQGYYPYVKQCSSAWMKVVPSPPPPQR